MYRLILGSVVMHIVEGGQCEGRIRGEMQLAGKQDRKSSTQLSGWEQGGAARPG